MKLSIIIINYKCKDILKKCIKCISYDKPYEIIIIDNDNSPEFLNKIEKLNNNIKIIPYKENLGFSKANNIGINKAKGEYILTLNADAFLTKSYIEKCINFLDKHKNYASCQGKLLLEDKKGYIDSTGNALTGTSFAYSENHKKKDYKIPSKEIFGVCAAAGVYRKSALEKIKIKSEYFDNDFFAYLEDVDLDWRLRLAGFNSYFVSDAICYHIRGATTNNKFRTNQALRNRLFLIIKNENTFTYLFNLIFYTPILLFLPNRIKNLKLLKKMISKRKLVKRKKGIKIKKEKTPWIKYIKGIKKLF